MVKLSKGMSEDDELLKQWREWVKTKLLKAVKGVNVDGETIEDSE